MFPQALNDTLKWNHRKPLIVKMLSEFSADILCLQEVDFYAKYYEQTLQDLGFEGMYAGKQLEGGDGLYVGWRADQYILLEYSVIDLCSTMQSLVEAGAHANIAQISLLKHTTHNKAFLLCNTHLYWKQGYDAVRLDQIDLIVSTCKAKHPYIENIILCGDLNSDPQSECCKHLDAHGFRSICTDMPYTVCSTSFTDTLDYIWVHPNSIQAEQCTLMDPNDAVSVEEGGIPNIMHPSDHLPIGANICLP